MVENTAAELYAVDVSPERVSRIRAEFGALRRLTVHHVDLGEPDDHGRPRGCPQPDDLAEYMNWLWCRDRKPDIVLVDGRFRVACFLTSLLRGEPGTHIIFSDYAGRTHDHVVEEVAGEPKRFGRHAIFCLPLLTPEQERTAGRLLADFRHVTD